MAIAIIKNDRSLNEYISQKLGTTSLPRNDSFLIDFQMFSQNLHVFRATDRNHELRCEMVLEVMESLVPSDAQGEEGAYLAPVVACSFPSISPQKLSEKISFDAYLRDILMFQFHLKILEQLFIFCEEKGAVNLILTMNDAEWDYLEIYSRFFILEEQVITSKGAQMRIVIPTDAHTYDEIIDFMDDLGKEFRTVLWRAQNTNLAFREYLKSNACL
jgi:hypothetical protein